MSPQSPQPALGPSIKAPLSFLCRNAPCPVRVTSAEAGELPAPHFTPVCQFVWRTHLGQSHQGETCSLQASGITEETLRAPVSSGKGASTHV